MHSLNTLKRDERFANLSSPIFIRWSWSKWQFDVEKFWRKVKEEHQLYPRYRKFFFSVAILYYLTGSCISYVTNYRATSWKRYWSTRFPSFSQRTLLREFLFLSVIFRSRTRHSMTTHFPIFQSRKWYASSQNEMKLFVASNYCPFN